MEMNKLKPVIKWSGSKRSQAEKITDMFPDRIETYYEPFIGGGSVFGLLLERKRILDKKVGKFVCSDINGDLILLWKTIKENPYTISGEYARHYGIFSKLPIAERKEYYSEVRDRFNSERSPYDFMWLDRTCFNGLIRYSGNGKFNSPCHFTRDGIKPEDFERIVLEWSALINRNDVEFRCASYEWIDLPSLSEDDFIYLDPPYRNTKGMYQGGFDEKRFFEWAKMIPCGNALSYDGVRGDDDMTVDLEGIYPECHHLESGVSSFNRIVTKEKIGVKESFYIKIV